MNLTQRDQGFIDLLASRLGNKLHVIIDEVERDFGRAGVRRPGGEASVGLYVVHHIGGHAAPGSWDWRKVWNFHTGSRGWDTGGYNAMVDHQGHIWLAAPPSRMTYGAGPRWNAMTLHIAALADYADHAPSPELLSSLYRWLITCDDVIGYRPWRPHGAIRQTQCPGAKLEPHVWTMTARGALEPRPDDYTG